MEQLQSLFENEDDHVRECILVAIGNIGSTKQGLLLLQEQRTFLQCILDSIPYVSGNLRVSALRSVSCLLSHHSNESDSICRDVYHSISGTFM
jgi:hypothetical protein